MKFILILWLYSASPTTAEFDTYKACMVAGASVVEKHKKADYVCMPKGDERK